MPLTTTLAGGSAPGFLPFYDPFNRPNGPLVAPWQSGGATWTIVSEEAINTPTEGGELVLNGNFTAWTGDNPDSWAVTGEVGADPEVSEVAPGNTHGGGGNGAANFFTSSGNVILITQPGVFTQYGWYVITVDITARASGNITVRQTGSTVFLAGQSAIQSYLRTGRANGALSTLQIQRGTAVATDITTDNISVHQLTLNTLFSGVETGTADVVCQVELDTVVAGTQAGLVLNLDDKDAPANFVIAYHDGVNAKLEKCVAGVYTPVISAATAYAAGATIQVTKSGTDYTLTYNSAQVGATSTINDAGIIDNTLHGMFSTYSGNQLDEFRCVRA